MLKYTTEISERYFEENLPDNHLTKYKGEPNYEYTTYHLVVGI